MRVGGSSLRLLMALAVVGACLVGMPGVAAAAGGSQPGPVSRVHPLVVGQSFPQRTTVTGGGLFCQEPSAQYHCYLPAQLRRAYDFNPLLSSGETGAGTTIAIIDAFQDPTIVHDLRRFDAVSGLAAPPAFHIVAPFGLTPFDPGNADEVGWSGEVALDVEWAHAMAPGAKIELVLAPSDANGDILATERYVIEHRLGDVLSMSYTEAERCFDGGHQADQHAWFERAVAGGMSLVAGAGDWGAAQFACVGDSFIKAVGTPASDPLVTSIGGTTLRADLHGGTYQSEEVWNDHLNAEAGGGGFSELYPRPAYQNQIGAPGTTRGVPDVTYSASFFWGAYVAWGSSGQGFEDWSFGGTSLGAPQWAALVAIADQAAGHDLGNINPSLYALPDTGSQTAYHDITVGNNSFPPISGYSAAPGWDPASGLGSPVATRIVAGLTGG